MGVVATVKRRPVLHVTCGLLWIGVSFYLLSQYFVCHDPEPPSLFSNYVYAFLGFRPPALGSIGIVVNTPVLLLGEVFPLPSVSLPFLFCIYHFSAGVLLTAWCLMLVGWLRKKRRERSVPTNLDAEQHSAEL